jgi:hypothetical protein
MALSFSGGNRARSVGLTAAAIATLAGGALVAASASGASSPKPTVCSGSPSKPGVLVGKVTGNVIVKGVCEVDHGSATVDGSLTVRAGGVFGAVFGHNDKTGKGVSDLKVTGDLIVGRGAAAFIGCEAAHSPCNDDSQTAPTLNNKVSIGGSIIANGALAVIAHVTKVGGNVVDNGGGGGVSCSTMPGFFAVIKSPAFSDFEDDSIAGTVTIENLGSCWLGALRDKVGKSFTLSDNKMADPDAIEIGANTIGGNLACSGNTNAVPSSAAVWDTTDISPNVTYPRAFKPNKVKGHRSGQCVKSTPTTMGGPYGAANTF